MTVAAQLLKLLIAKLAQRDVAQRELIWPASLEFLGNIGIKMHRLDDAIGQHATGNSLKLFARDPALDQISAPGSNFPHVNAHVTKGHLGGCSNRVRHPGLQMDFDPAIAIVVSCS